MRMYDVIQKKRDKGILTEEEIEYFVSGYSNGEIPDYQASAFLMTVFLNGMNDEETAFLTLAMAKSGDQVDLSSIPGVKVDKHSTGGVGDKTTLIIAPMVAANGVPVAKFSGKGLGHTGGTIDKLASIPGFRTELSMTEFLTSVKKIEIAIAGQTENLVPADKKLYALRDVTATIDAIPLIASSIMSKKIASGADRILLDVKCGSGAFMKNMEDAIALSKSMVSIGELAGRKTIALVTNMDVPLGNAIGNSLEIIEAIETLKGKGPSDLHEVCVEIAAQMLLLAGCGDLNVCRGLAEESITSGSALKKFEEMVKNQGGNSDIVRNQNVLAVSKFTNEFVAPYAGYVGAIDSECIGKASVLLGAGRETKESSIDYGAGLILLKKTGDAVNAGDVLVRMHTSNEEILEEALELLEGAYTISIRKPMIMPLILAKVSSEGVDRNIR